MNGTAPLSVEVSEMDCWPWRVRITSSDGRVKEDNYSSDFDPVGFARYISHQAGVERVEVTTAFADGNQVTPKEGTE
jgi:hypothetical protein